MAFKATTHSAVTLFSKKRPVYIHYLLLLGLVSLLAVNEVRAQLQPASPDETEKAPEPKWPEDSLGRRTPRGTVYGFLRAVADQNYRRAAHYLNLTSDINNIQEATDLVKDLQHLLDHSGNIMPYSWISEDTSGRSDDNLPPNLDRVGEISANRQTINLFVEVIEDPAGGPVWLFSSETVKKVAAVDLEHTVFFVDSMLPAFLQENTWGGVPIGHWLIMLFLIAFSYLLAWGITSLLKFPIYRLWQKAQSETSAGIIEALTLPIRLFVTVLLFVRLSQEAGISIIVRQWFSEVTLIIGLFAFLLLIWRLTDFISNYSKNRMATLGHLSGVSLVLFLRRVAKIAIVVFGGIAILGAFGIDVTAGLAALGIGGIALALGAQKAMENFVGSVTLIADRSVRVGDFCKAGDTIGTVESIGMRSTRIRTLDRTIVTIPNGEFSSSKIENYAHRDRFRFAPVFGLRYETTADQMRYLLVELRSILYAHPKVDPDPARVRFVEFGADSLNVEIFSYINAADFNEFLEVREDLLLRMIDVVESSGTGFAFPSQTLYLARDEGLNEEKSRTAEDRVKKWKETGEMQIPGFTPERIEELKNTINYPPEGSSSRKDS